MNKLEKVALTCAKKRGRPLVLVINNVHFFRNDDEGKNMLLQLQQRAESWAASGNFSSGCNPASSLSFRHFNHGFQHVSKCSNTFSSQRVLCRDDYWPFSIMRGYTLSWHDLSLRLS